MTPQTAEEQMMRVVCSECHFAVVVERGGMKPAEAIIEHGRNTGHTLTTEAPGPPR